MDRRRFLMGTGSLALAGVGGLFFNRTAAARELRETRRESWALGTAIKLVVLHDDESAANKALDAAFAEIDLIESVMSIYRPASQISRLNTAGFLKDPHPHFVAVLEHAQKMALDSDGAFDVTVQPLWQLFSDAKKQKALPSDGEVATARAKVDYRKLRVSSDEIRVDSGMQITLNGIAQGFAVDRTMAVLRENGIEHALIDTGEEGVIGRKAGGERWRAGIQHPRVTDALSAVIQLDGRCLSTSGDYQTYFSDDFANNHIFDPRTGFSPREFSSVSVLATTGTEADALSTAVFVLGIERGVKLLEARGADGFFIRKDGSTAVTRGFKDALCDD